MKKYLLCGIAKRIYIKARKLEQKDSEEILTSLSKKIDLSIYDKYEDEDFIILKLKEKIIKENTVEFLKEQTKKFQEFESLYATIQIKDLENKTYEDMIEISKRNSVIAFQYMEQHELYNDISYLDKTGKYEIYCDLIKMTSAGKVMLMCYWDTLNYFRNCIIQASNNPIKTAIVLTVAKEIELWEEY